MEDYIYEKVYPFKDDLDVDRNSEEGRAMIDLVRNYEKILAEHPHYVIPQAPKLFEKTVKECELIVKEFSGKIKATINYSSYTATIEMWCCYVEFQPDEFMTTLCSLSCYALSIRFTPMTSGELHIEIAMPYFTSIPTPGEIERYEK